MAETEATWALLLAAVLALAVATWFAVRYLLLRRSLRQVDRELREIVGHLEDNRIVKLPRPDADLEALLGTVNRALEGIRRQAVAYSRREAELKAQIERISHDLRTPLTSICGYLALVDEGALDAETRESLVVVRRKADSLQRLVAQFYELSRLRGDDERLEPASTDVGRFAREAVAEHYRLLEERGLDVRVAVPERPVCALADAAALERVLENLLHNAGKYARTTLEVTVAERCEAGVGEPRGGQAGGCGMRGCEADGERSGVGLGEGAQPGGGEASVGGGVGRGDCVAVTFSNDAASLSALQVARLFDPFYTVDASRSHESSGLGLAIARSLAERMGGTLGAHAEDRAGACWLTFVLVLRSC